MGASFGTRLVDAITVRDSAGLAALFTPDVDFKGLTPRRFWEASSPDEAVEIVLGNWFKEHDHVDGSSTTEGERIGDTDRVSYRLDLTTPDGPHVVEQQVYYRERDGAVEYLRLVCSGIRPA